MSAQDAKVAVLPIGSQMTWDEIKALDEMLKDTKPIDLESFFEGIEDDGFEGGDYE